MSAGPHSAPGSTRRCGVALALGLLLASCGGPVAETFDLSAARSAATQPLRARLRVSEPIADVDLDSDRILVRVAARRFATLAGARWSDRLPLVVQARLIQTFENARLPRKVGDRAATSADYELDIEIRAFELDVTASKVRVDLAAKFVSVGDGRVAAAQIFAAEAPVGSTGAAEVAPALNRALSSVMTRIVAFASTRL